MPGITDRTPHSRHHQQKQRIRSEKEETSLKMLGKGAPPHPLISIGYPCNSHRRLLFVNLKSSTKRVRAGHRLLIDNETHPHPPLHSLIPSSTDATPAGLAGSFGKLKAQKLKVLVNRASLIKQKIRKHGDELAIKDALLGKPVSSDSTLESVEKKKKNIVRVHKNEQKMSTQDFGDTIVNATGEDLKMSHYKIMPSKPQNSDSKPTGPQVSVPRGSASYLRGWGNGRSIHSLKSKFPGPSRQQHKISAENNFFSRKLFRDLGCSEFMIESLKRQVFLRPSHIQAMAFASVIKGKSCVIADQSGSGKTLAYLIPVIQRLREEELQGLGESSSRSPRVFIMVPTAELASQVLNNCRSMSKFGVPFRSMAVTGGFRQRTQLENLEEGVDVLIATPGRFMFLVKEGFLKLKNLRCAVLDEVDILFSDEVFEVALQSLINSSPVTTQYLFVTATLPVDVYNKLIEVFPDCEVIMGPGMHCTSAGLEEVLVDCSGGNGTEKTPDTAFLNKKSALLQLVKQSPATKTIVFCNKIEACRKVENVLKRFDGKGTCIRVLPFHAAIAQELRLANIREFMNSQPDEEALFLVCTDRASRGIDFAGVDHVVLFDFPRDPSEYVRRVGRTARGAGGKGKAFIFAVGKQVSIAKKIIERNQKGHPLHDVPLVPGLMY